MELSVAENYKSVTFHPVDLIEAAACEADTFELEELGWSMEHNSSQEALHVFLEATKYKWACAMEVSEVRYVLE